MPEIRNERPEDAETVDAVVSQAFGRGEKADLVACLRRNGRAVLSLVAEEGDRVLGHILFNPVIIEGAKTGFAAAGLASLAVLPAFQRLGIGSALVSAGLTRCRDLGFNRALVLGDPVYYQRFGFAPAATAGIRHPGDLPQETFMAVALEPGALDDCGGIARYSAEFGNP